MGGRARTRSLPTMGSPGDLSVTLITTNSHKARETREILAPYGVRVRWSRQKLPEPQADRLEDVVQAKLSAARGKGWLLVEDSGIFLKGLGGFPGVYSDYVHRTLGLAGVLRLLEGRARAAEFITVAGLKRGARRRLFRGRTTGQVALAPKGNSGFGYDPIFVPNGRRRTFAETGPAGKNALSHRGRAMRAVARFLLSRASGIKRRKASHPKQVGPVTS
jgi:XTP/dITP diphosphohydrolase